MIDSIWVVSPRGYPHHCFEEVAQALSDSAKDIGIDLPVTHGLKVETENPLVLGACLFTGYQELPKGAVIFNMEQEGSPWLKSPFYLEACRYHPVVEFDPVRAANLERPYLGIGYHPVLRRIPRTHEDIDVFFYGSINPRRRHVIDGLRHAGLLVAESSCVYGRERDEFIHRSKIVLNAHFYEGAQFEIVRCSYLFSNSKCVVSERSGMDPQYEKMCAAVDYDSLVSKCVELARDHDQRMEVSDRAFSEFSKLKQADYLKSAIEQLEMIAA